MAALVTFVLSDLVIAAVKLGITIKKETDASAAADKISAVVTNTSSKAYKVTYYEPNHGKWVQTPDSALASIGDSARTYEGKARKDLGSGASSDEIKQWILQHIKVAPGDVVNDNVMEFSAEGAGSGTEVAIILTERDDADARIVLLIRKRPGGLYGAGVSMSNGSWFTDSEYDLAADDDGSGICSHIRETSTTLCMFSSGDPAGSEVVTRFNGIKVTTRAEQRAGFLIEDDD